MIRIRQLGVWFALRSDLGSTSHRTPHRPSEEIRSHSVKEGCGLRRSLLTLGAGLAPGVGVELLSVVETRATNHERFPRHAADEADKSAQGILEVFGHGRYATSLRYTIVCL